MEDKELIITNEYNIFKSLSLTEECRIIKSKVIVCGEENVHGESQT